MDPSTIMSPRSKRKAIRDAGIVLEHWAYKRTVSSNPSESRYPNTYTIRGNNHAQIARASNCKFRSSSLLSPSILGLTGTCVTGDTGSDMSSFSDSVPNAPVTRELDGPALYREGDHQRTLGELRSGTTGGEDTLRGRQGLSSFIVGA